MSIWQGNIPIRPVWKVVQRHALFVLPDVESLVEGIIDLQDSDTVRPCKLKLYKYVDRYACCISFMGMFTKSVNIHTSSPDIMVYIERISHYREHDEAWISFYNPNMEIVVPPMGLLLGISWIFDDSFVPNGWMSDEDDDGPKKIKDDQYCSCKNPVPKQVDTGFYSVWTICDRCKKELRNEN